MAGRDAAKETARVVAAVGAYLDRAVDDASLTLSYDGIAKACGVSRTHFAKASNPEYLALVERIALVRRARDSTPLIPPVVAVSARPTLDELRTRAAPSPSSHSLTKISDEELVARLDAEVNSAAATMKRWLGYARASVGGVDAALLAQDLEKAINSLHAVHSRLKPLASLREDRLLVRTSQTRVV
jgi:hypothetical protein